MLAEAQKFVCRLNQNLKSGQRDEPDGYFYLRHWPRMTISYHQQSSSVTHLHPPLGACPFYTCPVNPHPILLGKICPQLGQVSGAGSVD